jgi:hypothetical protein
LRFLDHKNALGGAGMSSLPPPPLGAEHEHGGPLDVDASTPSLRPEMIGGHDDDSGRPSGF